MISFNKRTPVIISVVVDIKHLLYSSIDDIGRDKIRIDIASDIDACRKYCIEIIRICRTKLKHEENDEAIGTLCEALLHFMLTVSLLPSERKVRMRDVDLDLVIPSTRMLLKTPDAALVIQVIKDNDLTAKVRQAESLQPNGENIWLISPKQIVTEYRNYHLESENFPYSQIIADISAFLAKKGNRGPKLLYGH